MIHMGSVAFKFGGQIQVEVQRKMVQEIINAINREGYDAMLVGSIAKNTCLQGSKDIDIFILFT